MPISLRSSKARSDVLEHLAASLPNSQIVEVEVDSSHEPLLILQTSHVVAAFSFSSDDVQHSYDVMYPGFKRYYREQGGKWDALDLAFVFIVVESGLKIDQFCSHVETDVYFCRKFVIPLGSQISASLARLPFLPLDSLRGESLRPPSAQTLLQQSGMPSVLAKYLVMQHERSAEGIVEDCVAGEFGEVLSLTSARPAKRIRQESNAESIRLESIQIANFRAYRKPQTLELGADVTVLYGPNGFGKTSFFDAVDFAITGGIGRSDSRKQSDFDKVARHLDAGLESSTVGLTFRSKGVVRKIVRSLRDRKTALLDDSAVDRKAVLAALTGSEIDRVEHFVSLFRASHLFSQEQQELTKDFQDDCRLSADIVSRMLAFEDYANAVKKVSKVREVLQTILANCSKEIRELREQIEKDKSELARLGQTATEHANTFAIEQELDTLRSRASVLGISMPEGKVDAFAVRGCRAALEARHSEIHAANERLAMLLDESASLPKLREEVSGLQAQADAAEGALSSAEKKRTVAESLIRILEKQKAGIAAARANVRAEMEALAWIRNSQPQYRRLLSLQRDLTEEIKSGADRLAELTAMEEEAATEILAKNAEAAQVERRSAPLRAELVAMKSIRSQMPGWHSDKEQLIVVCQSQQAKIGALESTRTQLSELVRESESILARKKSLTRQIADIDASQSELRQLLSQLQAYIQSGVCPLCGEDHGSTDRLLSRIQAVVASDGASSAREELLAINSGLSDLNEKKESIKREQISIEVSLSELVLEKQKLESRIDAFLAHVSKTSINPDAHTFSLSEQAQAIEEQLQRDVDELERQRLEIAGASGAARSAALASQSEANVLKVQANQKSASLARIQHELASLVHDPRLGQHSLEIEPEDLNEAEGRCAETSEGLQGDAAKNEENLAKQRTTLDSVKAEVVVLRSQLNALRVRLNQLKTTSAQIEAKFSAANLPLDSTSESLLALISENSRIREQLSSLRDTASNLELALDAATTAAALTTLRQTLNTREEALEQVSSRYSLHKPWVSYFDEILRVLSAQQNEGVGNFTFQYGPRTSVIQRRLRSVYGFDDVQMKSRESTISVRVMRNGQELRPVDYFSQSQQQTLLLSLFLTACSSQTWSAFSPVFLDDPVAHFDDLNTFAFLDLLVGLLGPGVGQRQFILSTCDEKLLDLALQKFRYLGERSKFYRFTAIGADGPVIEEINCN